MQERTDVVKFQGQPLTLLGPALKVGDKAPSFSLVDSDLNAVSLGDFRGKTKIICTLPSLDTPVCDAEVRRFNQEAIQLNEDTLVLVVSADLPFAQKRWCAAADVDRVKTLSDYQELSFATDYGVLMKETKLLCRAIFVVDGEDRIQHVEIVPELSAEPDYAAALAAAKSQIKVTQVPGDGICGGY